MLLIEDIGGKSAKTETITDAFSEDTKVLNTGLMLLQFVCHEVIEVGCVRVVHQFSFPKTAKE